MTRAHKNDSKAQITCFGFSKHFCLIVSRATVLTQSALINQLFTPTYLAMHLKEVSLCLYEH